jgi:hypothetical protein
MITHFFSSPARLLLLVSIAATLSSCTMMDPANLVPHALVPHKMGGNPANLHIGATAMEVVAEMGSPTYCVRHERGETWVYADYWWTKEIWTPHFGTWEIYMRDRPDRYFLNCCGWKLIDPPYQEPAVRSRIVVDHRVPAVVAVPEPTPKLLTKVTPAPKPNTK